MEFAEKLVQLRKGKGFTQEQLAEALFVSRTAVSKWETGRGIPSIDSLKEIANFFGVTVDELLSADALLDAALDQKRSLSREWLQSASAWLSLTALACAALPLYRLSLGEGFVSVPLYQLEGEFALVFAVLQLAMAACGAVALAALRLARPRVAAWSVLASDALCAALAVVFAASTQPYPACIFIVLLVFKLTIKAKF